MTQDVPDHNDAGQTRLCLPRYHKNAWQQVVDVVTEETPLKITWLDETRSLAGETVLWAWPLDPAPLALGHVLLDILPSEPCLHREALVSAEARHSDPEDGNKGTAPGNVLSFHVRAGASRPGAPPPPPAVWQAEDLFTAMHEFINAPGHWDGTGCFHRAGVFDPQNNSLLVRAEDTGRHNCIDRLAGWSVLHGVPLSDKALLTSARLTSSLCAKALRAGFRILVSRSAVTTAAIDMADMAGATLVGFARTKERRFTVFADKVARLGRTFSPQNFPAEDSSPETPLCAGTLPVAGKS